MNDVVFRTKTDLESFYDLLMNLFMKNSNYPK